METFYTYILTNKHNTVLYVGVTNNIERRISEHRQNNHTGFTARYNCHKLVYIEEFSSISEAIAREKQIKSWNRNRKEKLIDQLNPERKDLLL